MSRTIISPTNLGFLQKINGDKNHRQSRSHLGILLHATLAHQQQLWHLEPQAKTLDHMPQREHITFGGVTRVAVQNLRRDLRELDAVIDEVCRLEGNMSTERAIGESLGETKVDHLSGERFFFVSLHDNVIRLDVSV